MQDIDEQTWRMVTSTLDSYQRKKLGNRLRRRLKSDDKTPRLNALIGGHEPAFTIEEISALLPKDPEPPIHWPTKVLRILAQISLILLGAIAGFLLLNDIDLKTKLFLIFIECSLIFSAFLRMSKWLSLLYVIPLLLCAHYLDQQPKVQLIKDLKSRHASLKREVESGRKNVMEISKKLQNQRLRCDSKATYKCRIYDSGTKPLQDLLLKSEDDLHLAKRNLASFEEEFGFQNGVFRKPKLDLKKDADHTISVFLDVFIRATVMLLLYLFAHHFGERQLTRIEKN